MAYYLMATACGIEMMESRLMEKMVEHFMTNAFDHCWAEKHHIQTLCAIQQHYDFSQITSYSYEQFFQIRTLRLPPTETTL
jgi:serine/threonine-protein kinase HipA